MESTVTPSHVKIFLNSFGDLGQQPTGGWFHTKQKQENCMLSECPLNHAPVTNPGWRAAEIIDVIKSKISESKGRDFFWKLARQLSLFLGVKYVIISEFIGPFPWRARTLSVWLGDHFGENYEYYLSNTPCHKMLAGHIVYYPLAIQRLFPQDQDLVELGAESYMGSPLKDPTGRVIGHIALMHPCSMRDEALLKTILHHFACVAGRELVRYQKMETKTTLGGIQ